MSRKKRPAAKKAEPKPKAVQVEKPEPAKVTVKKPSVKAPAKKPSAKITVGKPLPIHLGLAAAIERAHGVPKWLTLLAAATGSNFGASCPATNNVCGIMADGTEQNDGNGVAWFPKIPMGFQRFGIICQRLKLNYKRPEACIKALKVRCPNIDTIPYKQYMKVK